MITDSEKLMFRKLIPVLIKPNLATGFNVIKTRDISRLPNAPFRLQYLHAKVNSGSEHYQEILELAKAYGCEPKPISILRWAYYSTELEWGEPIYGDYLDLDGNCIPEKEIMAYSHGRIVKEDKEYMMSLSLDREQDVLGLMRSMHKVCFEYKVNSDTGAIISENKNPTRSQFAYKVPFILLSTKHSDTLKPFVKVSSFWAKCLNGKYSLNSIMLTSKAKALNRTLLPREFTFESIDHNSTYLSRLAHEYLKKV